MQAIYCPLNNWSVGNLSTLRESNFLENDEFQPPIPYYIPIFLVPIFTFIVLCFACKRCNLYCCAAGKRGAQFEQTHNRGQLTWTHRKGSFAFVPMQPWDISNELITAESENILENIAPSQRHNNVQLTGKSFLKNSNTGGPDINVTRGNLYDKVVLELETNFEQV